MPSYEQSTLIHVSAKSSPSGDIPQAPPRKRFQVAVAEDAKCKSALFLELQTASAPDHPNGPLAFGTRATA